LGIKLFLDANNNGVADAGEQISTSKTFASGFVTFDALT